MLVCLLPRSDEYGASGEAGSGKLVIVPCWNIPAGNVGSLGLGVPGDDGDGGDGDDGIDGA
jgi:hypothetical protein